MKKFISLLVVLVVAMVCAVGCKGSPTAELKLDKNSVNLTLFGQTRIEAVYNNISEITWENNAENVVSMKINGDVATIDAIGSGMATITVTGGDLVQTCKIFVAETDDKMALSVNGYEEIVLRKGNTISIPTEVTFSGKSLDNVNLIYTAEENGVVTVSETGLISAVATGESIVTIKAEKFGIYSNECAVKIIVKDGPMILVNKVNVFLYETDWDDDVNIYPGEQKISVSIIDGDNIIKNVDYEAEVVDENVVSFLDGVIKKVGIGETVINISCNYQGVEYTAQINVKVLNNF